MNIGRVVGSVWATRKYKALKQRRMLFLQPMTFVGEDIGGKIVALDTMDAGIGDTVIYVSSTEASVPFKPIPTPSDATIVGIIDRVDHVERSWKPARS